MIDQDVCDPKAKEEKEAEIRAKLHDKFSQKILPGAMFLMTCTQIIKCQPKTMT